MTEEESHLQAELEKVRPLYQKISSQSVSQEVEDKILGLARNKARRRNWGALSLFRAPFTRGQISAIATLGALVVISAWFVNELWPGAAPPGDIAMSKSLTAAMSKIDQDELIQQVAKALSTVSELNNTTPASNEWNIQVDELMKTEVPTFTKYGELANKLEAAGNTEEAQEIRELTEKLQKMFEQRNPDWLNNYKDD